MAKKRVNEKTLFNEIREHLSGEKEETPITKKVFQDKITGQISLRLPKEICVAKNITKDSEFEIVLNPKEERWDELKKQNLLIRIKEEK